ncbi:surface antigen-domain-containing protein, partial [Naematelia encephala]
MDPNSEAPPPTVENVQVGVEVLETPITPTSFQPPLSSSIFSNAFPPPPPRRPQAPYDPEKERQQNEEEFQRRLRGEYQAAQQRVGEVVNDNMNRPLRLTSIRLSPPPPTTRSTFLRSLLNPFLTPPSPHLPAWLNPSPIQPTTLQEILLSTRAMVGHLDKFGIFDMDRVGVRFEPVRGGDEDEVEMVLALRERGRLFLQAGTEVGGGEGGGNVTGRIRNAFGGAEVLEGQAAIGTKTKSAYQVSLTTPLLASPLLSLALTAFSQDRDHSAFASHRERSQGGRAQFSATTPWGRHDLLYELIRREIGHLSPNASISVREESIQSTKSSLIHTWTSDTRDDPWLGTSGRLLKFSHEYAGLPGSSDRAHFFKSTTQSQLSRALYPGSNIHYSIASLTTFLFPLFPKHLGRTLLPDRTFLGGPNSVRGWKVGGLGLRDGPDSLGGELSWGLGVSLFSPIPRKEHWPLRLHSFLNIGKVVGYDRDVTFADNVARMYRNPNVSVGLGLLYRLDPVRVEVNFTMPLVGRRGERTARGFGVGVGLEFL